ncbi:MAG: ABC transporter substrate-binding protein [Dehalococcoidia bacterium]
MTDLTNGGVWYELARRRRLSRRGVLGWSAAGATALAATSCSSGNKSSAGSGAPKAQSTAASAGATPAGQPRQGGSVSYTQTANPPNFSVFTASNDSARTGNPIYSKLIRFKTGAGIAPDQLVLEPDLATSLPEQPDNLSYVFKLRPNVKFQNVDPVNGRALMADDVKQAINAYLTNPKSAFKDDLKTVDHVETPDQSTVKLVMKQPWAPLLSTAAGQYGLRIFPPELLQGNLIESKPIGSGPWILKEYTPGSKIVYGRNPDYYLPGIPHLDSQTIYIIPTEAGITAALESGTLDIASGTSSLSCINAPTALAKIANAQHVDVPGVGLYLALDTSKPPFNDARVRQAVALSIDRQTMQASLYCGKGELDQLVPVSFDHRVLKVDQLGAAAQYWKHDLKTAKQLLGAAGFANGFAVDLHFTPAYATTNRYADALQLVVANLKDAGITATAVSHEYSQWISSFYRPPFNWTGMLMGPSRYYPDPDNYVRYWLSPQGITNQSRINDPAITDLLAKEEMTFDEAQRWSAMGDLEKRVADQQYYVTLTTGISTVAWPSWLQNYSVYSGYDQPQFDTAWSSKA